MEYAIVKAGGKQYKVEKGSVIDVDRVEVETGKEMEFDDVLLVAGDGRVKIGKPRVKDAKVKAKVLDHIKGDKVRVAKFKSKVRYRKVMGFRPSISRIQITEIGS